MKTALAALAIAAALLVSSVALANKTVTYLLAGSEVTSLHFDIQGATVVATVCGRAPLQSGGFSSPTCYPTSLTSGTIFTNVMSLATGAALTFWQGKEGL